AGQVLVVGSSPACGLRLNAPDIAGMHCTIEYNDEGISVRDWSTEAGTYLDGRRIEEQQVSGAAFELRIAGYLIQARKSVLGAESPHETGVTDDIAEMAADSNEREQSGQHEDALRDLRDCDDVLESQEHKAELDDEARIDSETWDRDFDP